MRAAGKVPPGLFDEVRSKVRRIEQKTGRKFGDEENPLLFSVRSGAPFSMPGMMDTVLNIGLNDRAVEEQATATGNPRFVYDSYRRLIQMFGKDRNGGQEGPVRGTAGGAQEEGRGGNGRRPWPGGT